MRASILVDLLLELNIINVEDIDREMNQMAAGVADPRAASWIKRVARYFLINIEQLLSPRKILAEPRGGTRYQGAHAGAELHSAGSKYHFTPSGKWLGHGPDPALPSEPSELEPQTWRTQLHQPAVQKDIERSFQPFVPKKAKAKGILWGPPSKKKLALWMKTYAPKPTPAEEDEPEALKAAYKQGLYHFDPIVVRRRELFARLYDVVNYFNWKSELALKINSENAPEKAEAQEALLLFRRLETMKTADLEGFVEIMQEAAAFMDEVKDNPEKFSRSQPTTVFTFPRGYHWVHLHTKTQMQTEGDRMHHCIGGGGYFCKFEQGTHDYYSLRDKRGIPHISIEVRRTRPPQVEQVKGSGNQKPGPDYQPYLRPFFDHMHMQLVGDAYNVD